MTPVLFDLSMLPQTGQGQVPTSLLDEPGNAPDGSFEALLPVPEETGPSWVRPTDVPRPEEPLRGQGPQFPRDEDLWPTMAQPARPPLDGHSLTASAPGAPDGRPAQVILDPWLPADTADVPNAPPEWLPMPAPEVSPAPWGAPELAPRPAVPGPEMPSPVALDRPVALSGSMALDRSVGFDGVCAVDRQVNILEHDGSAEAHQVLDSLTAAMQSMANVVMSLDAALDPMHGGLEALGRGPVGAQQAGNTPALQVDAPDAPNSSFDAESVDSAEPVMEQRRGPSTAPAPLGTTGLQDAGADTMNGPDAQPRTPDVENRPAQVRTAPTPVVREPAPTPELAARIDPNGIVRVELDPDLSLEVRPVQRGVEVTLEGTPQALQPMEGVEQELDAALADSDSNLHRFRQQHRPPSRARRDSDDDGDAAVIDGAEPLQVHSGASLIHVVA